MRILGIDYGEKRVGVAVSDPLGIIALPLRVLEVRSDADALAAIESVCAETETEKIVVGFPLNMNGTVGESARKAQAFAEELAKRVSLPVDMWDERLSTAMADRVMIEGGAGRGKRRLTRDKLAAQVILQGYLDSGNEEQNGYDAAQDHDLL